MLAQSTTSPTSPPQVSKPTVYIVDDETMIGEVVEVILSLEGYQPRFFQNPKLALQAIADGERPDLLLTDFAMAPLNGMELIEQVRKIVPELRTILYSGNVGEEVMQHYQAKPNGFLSKPFLPKALIALVQKTLEG